MVEYNSDLINKYMVNYSEGVANLPELEGFAHEEAANALRTQEEQLEFKSLAEEQDAKPSQELEDEPPVTELKETKLERPGISSN